MLFIDTTSYHLNNSLGVSAKYDAIATKFSLTNILISNISQVLVNIKRPILLSRLLIPMGVWILELRFVEFCSDTLQILR